MTDEPTVLARRDGRAGRIIVNRPKALNALDAEMVRLITLALERWRDDPDIHIVIIEGRGDRAFCAGGDVRRMREYVVAGDFDSADAFFVEEYALNRTIARYPKPFIALIDGLWMGGGVGISVHGAYRVVSEHAVFSMPETRIALFPDIGATYVLPRLRGEFGLYLGLTGERVGAGDACWLGLATHYVPRAAIAALGDALARDGLGALVEHARPPPDATFGERQQEVDTIFGRINLGEIRAGLASCVSAWAKAALEAIESGSPASVQWTFDIVRAGAHRTLEQCLRAELLLTRIALRHPDFVEGVRAMIIDKDRAPKWQPA